MCIVYKSTTTQQFKQVDWWMHTPHCYESSLLTEMLIQLRQCELNVENGDNVYIVTKADKYNIAFIYLKFREKETYKNSCKMPNKIKSFATN